MTAVRIGSRRIDGDTFRSELGLASTWFQVGDLSLTRRSPRDRLRREARSRRASRRPRPRAASAPHRRRRLEDAEAASTAPAQVTVEPQGQTLYRLSADGVTGPVVGVAVAPRLHVTPAGTQLLTGAVTPLSRGAVTVWLKVGRRLEGRRASADRSDRAVQHAAASPPRRLPRHGRRRRSLRGGDGERARHCAPARFARQLESRA